MLPIATTAPLRYMLARWYTTVLAWLNDRQQLTTAKIILLLRKLNLYQLALNDAGNEHHATIIHAG
jgi:hypothetical protein